MKVLFVFPTASERYSFIDFHHGIAWLSACLKRFGHETQLFQASAFEQKRIDRLMDSFNPDILAFSFTSDYAGLAKKYMQHLRKYLKFSIAGGIHPTVMPDDVVDHVDCLCIGEGEQAILDLASGNSLQNIASLVYKENGHICKNTIRPFLQDLDQLPFPDRELFDYQKALDQDHRADFMVGRGCAYRCTYCVNNQLLHIASGRFVRLRSVENVLQEIKNVLNDYQGIDSICFQDDTFALRQNWTEEFCRAYKKQIGLPYVCNLRADRIDQHLVEILSDSGCTEVRIGVEQGNEELRSMVMRRKMSNAQIIKSFDLVRRAGIKIFAYNMVGIPGETEETIQETIALNRLLQPHKMHVSIFRPYPGTDLYDLCKERGYLLNVETDSFFQPVASIDLPTISKQRIEYWFRLFRPAVNYPRFLWVFKALVRIKAGKNKTLYDCLFDIVYAGFRFVQKNIPQRIKDPLFKRLRI